MEANQDQLSIILERLEIIQNRILSLQKEHFDELIENSEFMRMMKISKRTAQYWRDHGVVPFIRIRNRIYYRKSDVQALLERNYKRKS